MEIVNKVAQSGLRTIDLEELYVPGERVVLDIKDWLYEEQILKEKVFRGHLIEHDWLQYKNKLVALTCSADAIVPTWAYMLVALNLASVATEVYFGDLQQMETHLYLRKLAQLNPEDYRDQRIVIKGCANKDVPVSVYVEISRLLQPVVKSVMYGEACSTVPLYKRKD